MNESSLASSSGPSTLAANPGVRQRVLSIFGGTAEYVGTWLKLAGHEAWFFGYVSGCILCSLLVYGFMRDTRRHSRFD